MDFERSWPEEKEARRRSIDNIISIMDQYMDVPTPPIVEPLGIKRWAEIMCQWKARVLDEFLDQSQRCVVKTEPRIALTCQLRYITGPFPAQPKLGSGRCYIQSSFERSWPRCQPGGTLGHRGLGLKIGGSVGLRASVGFALEYSGCFGIQGV